MERLSLGLALPVVLAQSGDETADAPDAARVLGDSKVPLTAVGDVGIGAKLTLVQPTGGDFGGFALAVSERFTLPSGDEASYVGEGHVTSTTRLLAEYRLVALGVHASAGTKFRGEEERYALRADTFRRRRGLSHTFRPRVALRFGSDVSTSSPRHR